MSNQSSGKYGEDIAVEYLKKNKYTILERNFRIRNGEVDIIAIDRSEDEPVLSFIEVKTRNTEQFGTPFEAVTYYKLQALMRSAQVYKSLHRRLPDLMRIDAISITFLDKKPLIQLVKNVSG